MPLEDTLKLPKDDADQVKELRKWLEMASLGDVPDTAFAIYSYMRMEGYKLQKT